MTMVGYLEIDKDSWRGPRRTSRRRGGSDTRRLLLVYATLDEGTSTTQCRVSFTPNFVRAPRQP